MLDAVVISDSGADTYSASSPMRLQLDGRLALIQHVRNFVANGGRLGDPIEGENEKSWRTAPKLNGVRLFSYLMHEGFRAALVDSFQQERQRLADLLADGVRAVVISTTFIIDKKGLADLAAQIRSLAPQTKIIAGGPFVYSSFLLAHRTAKQYDVRSPRHDFLFLSPDRRPDVDLYIADKDGLPILAQALRRLQRDESLTGLPNTVRWDEAEPVFAHRLESVPTSTPIAWDTLPERLFAGGVVNLQASVGCPFRCAFCNFVKDSRHTYVKPLDQLIAELKAVQARGVRYVRFVDDNFRLGRHDLNDVCRRFIAEGLRLKWMSFLRAGTLDHTDLDLLREAGCVEVQIGIESADDALLTAMKKGSSSSVYRRVLTGLLERGINCSCCFVVGFPGETRATFERTLEFINGISHDDQDGIFSWSIYPFMLFPLSPIYDAEERARHGLDGYMQEWEHDTMTSRDARELTFEAFLRIETSGPIYSGDNMDMLLELPPRRRKAFMETRHALSKRLFGKPFDRNLVLNAFSRVFSETQTDADN